MQPQRGLLQLGTLGTGNRGFRQKTAFAVKWTDAVRHGGQWTRTTFEELAMGASQLGS
jgi:hypothetical protein